MEVSFVIPCYHSTNSLENLVADLCQLARESLRSFEVILVRDSNDSQTRFLLNKLVAEFQEVRQVILSRNSGQQAATVAGIVATKGAIVVTLDDDSQHRPHDALRMACTLRENSETDLVYGLPTIRQESLLKSWGRRFFRKVLTVAGLRFAQSLSPFRAFRGHVRPAFQAARGPNLSVDVILSWVVEKPSTLECDFAQRENGTSGYSRLDLLRLAFGILLAYSTQPLRFGVYLGGLGILLSLAYASVTVWIYVVGGTSVPGFTTIALLVMILGSLQLLLLGIIGVYLGQQHRRSMAQPAYLIVNQD